MRETFVIVGVGLTGGSAVVALREEGFGGDLVLIGAEPEVPYERPPLSKEYLRGEATFEDTLVRPPNFYSDKGIETRLGIRATKVDLEGKVVELEGGTVCPATRSSSPLVFPVPLNMQRGSMLDIVTLLTEPQAGQHHLRIGATCTHQGSPLVERSLKAGEIVQCSCAASASSAQSYSRARDRSAAPWACSLPSA